ncbi:hypothetical protein RRG08_012893, partial [Elysia crispata]
NQEASGRDCFDPARTGSSAGHAVCAASPPPAGRVPEDVTSTIPVSGCVSPVQLTSSYIPNTHKGQASGKKKQDQTRRAKSSAHDLRILCALVEPRLGPFILTTPGSHPPQALENRATIIRRRLHYPFRYIFSRFMY